MTPSLLFSGTSLSVHLVQFSRMKTGLGSSDQDQKLESDLDFATAAAMAGLLAPMYSDLKSNVKLSPNLTILTFSL